jgi:uncharacterized protein YndB with AHSA1/START domain
VRRCERAIEVTRAYDRSVGRYRFVTDWRVDAPTERVWDAIHDSERWPEWWRGVLAVDRLPSQVRDDADEVRRYTFRGRLPYSLTFDMRVTRSEPPSLLEGRASGELEGTGTWTFSDSADGCEVRYIWDIRTTRPWMNLPIPFARPIFTANHDVIMRWGAEGLERLLGARVTDRTGATSDRATGS